MNHLSEKIMPAFPEFRKAIVFESSELFVPYLSVVLLSLIEHISCKNKYDIIVLTNEIEEYDQAKIIEAIEGLNNVKIRFFNPDKFVKRYIENSRYKYLDINYYRMSLPWILTEYDKVLNLGADIVIERDIAELLACPMEERQYIGGAIDLGYLGRLRLDIPREELGLSNPEGYVNADVLLYNLKSIRRDFSQDEVMEVWQKYHFRCAEQDALNLLFDGNIKYVNLRWNVFPERMASVEHIMKNDKERINEWKYCLRNPYIIHYAAYPKPWDYPLVGYGEKWLKYARMSPYYEEIIRRMCLNAVRNDTKTWGRRILDFLFPFQSKRRKYLKNFFPKNSIQRNILKKIYYTFFNNPNKEWNKKFGKCNYTNKKEND